MYNDYDNTDWDNYIVQHEHYTDVRDLEGWEFDFTDIEEGE